MADENTGYDSGDDYSLQTIFEDMEDDIIASYRRNMQAHTEEEVREGFAWKMWQLLKFRDLKRFRANLVTYFKQARAEADRTAEAAIRKSFVCGVANAKRILHDLKAKGADIPDIDEDAFFRMNEQQMVSLIQAVRNDLGTKEQAILRMGDDVFRSTMYKAEMYYTTGTKTLWQAVDMASRDFLDRGINCIQYKNGARVNIASYAEMCLRTSKKKAYMVGEGRRAAASGVTLCQITQYAGCSETCRPWQGRVYVDDVYAGGQADGEHTLLSLAIENGLFHPNCRHAKQPYYPGISEDLKPLDSTAMQENYTAEQRQREIERNIRKYKRRAAGSLDSQNRAKAQTKVSQWQSEMREHLKQHPQLRREYAREQTYGVPETAKRRQAKAS